MIYRDIIIVGGGASGMMCAIKAKENNPKKSVVIIEKQGRIGRKILSTGNGRCNLCNEQCSKSDFHGSFAEYFDKFAENVPPQKIIDEFFSLGLLTKTEAEGRIYPISNHASSVLDVLRYRLEFLDVEIICETTVKNIKKIKNNFEIITDGKKFHSEKVVLATGSPASPKLGGTENGLNFLKTLGHNVCKFYPALSPIKVKSDILTLLKGLRVQGKVSLFDGKKLIREEKGEIQFAEKALSGICVFNLSTYLNKVKNPYLKVNLMPDFSENLLKEILNKNKKIFSDRTLEDYFTGIFQKKLGIALFKTAEIYPLSRKVSSLEENEINKLTSIIRNWEFQAYKDNDLGKSQACAGGVIGKEINPLTMESKIVKNLYILGECVDIVGDCGGYNLYFAFASGIIAGENL